MRLRIIASKQVGYHLCEIVLSQWRLTNLPSFSVHITKTVLLLRWLNIYTDEVLGSAWSNVQAWPLTSICGSRGCRGCASSLAPIVPKRSQSHGFYWPQRSCGQGYVFTRVCDSVHGGGVCLSACWETTSPGKQTLAYGQWAAGSIRLGMHSCLGEIWQNRMLAYTKRKEHHR